LHIGTHKSTSLENLIGEIDCFHCMHIAARLIGHVIDLLNSVSVPRTIIVLDPAGRTVVEVTKALIGLKLYLSCNQIGL